MGTQKKEIPKRKVAEMTLDGTISNPEYAQDDLLERLRDTMMNCYLKNANPVLEDRDNWIEMTENCGRSNHLEVEAWKLTDGYASMSTINKFTNSYNNSFDRAELYMDSRHPRENTGTLWMELQKGQTPVARIIVLPTEHLTEALAQDDHLKLLAKNLRGEYAYMKEFIQKQRVLDERKAHGMDPYEAAVKEALQTRVGDDYVRADEMPTDLLAEAVIRNLRRKTDVTDEDIYRILTDGKIFPAMGKDAEKVMERVLMPKDALKQFQQDLMLANISKYSVEDLRYIVFLQDKLQEKMPENTIPYPSGQEDSFLRPTNQILIECQNEYMKERFREGFRDEKEYRKMLRSMADYPKDPHSMKEWKRNQLGEELVRQLTKKLEKDGKISGLTAPTASFLVGKNHMKGIVEYGNPEDAASKHYAFAIYGLHNAPLKSCRWPNIDDMIVVEKELSAKEAGDARKRGKAVDALVAKGKQKCNAR